MNRIDEIEANYRILERHCEGLPKDDMLWMTLADVRFLLSEVKRLQAELAIATNAATVHFGTILRMTKENFDRDHGPGKCDCHTPSGGMVGHAEPSRSDAPKRPAINVAEELHKALNPKGHS